MESKITMSQYLLYSSHTWVCKERLAALNSGVISTYFTRQLRECQETIKLFQDEDDVVNSFYGSKLGAKQKSNNVMVQDGEKPYKCSHLNIQMKPVTGEKPNTCATCDKQFDPVVCNTA